MKLRNILLFSLLFIGLMVNAQKKIVILGTNDTHSRIEPIPENDKSYGGMGGVVAREAFIEEIRKQNKNVLLFDAGDFVQGTPYFNLFHHNVRLIYSQR